MRGENVFGMVREELLGRTVREVRPFVPTRGWRFEAESLGRRQLVGKPRPEKARECIH